MVPTSTFDRRAYSPENLGSVRQKVTSRNADTGSSKSNSVNEINASGEACADRTLPARAAVPMCRHFRLLLASPPMRQIDHIGVILPAVWELTITTFS